MKKSNTEPCFVFYRLISKTVESLTVQDARPSPSSAPAAAHVCCGEWFLALHYSCMKQPNEAEPGTHVFVLMSLHSGLHMIGELSRCWGEPEPGLVV